MLRFADCRGVQPLRTGRLVYSLLIVQIWATCRQGVAQIGRSGGERFATFWGIHGEFGTTQINKPAFSILWFIFNGLIPRSCSTLPLLSFHLSTAWLKLDLQFGIQSLLIPYILLFCFVARRCSYLMALYRDLLYFCRDFIVYFCRALALLDGAISGLVVLEISPSTHREVVWSSWSVGRVYLWPESV